MLWHVMLLPDRFFNVYKGLNRYGKPKQTNAQKHPFNVEQKLKQIGLFKHVSPLICSPPIEQLVFEKV